MPEIRYMLYVRQAQHQCFVLNYPYPSFSFNGDLLEDWRTSTTLFSRKWWWSWASRRRGNVYVVYIQMAFAWEGRCLIGLTPSSTVSKVWKIDRQVSRCIKSMLEERDSKNSSIDVIDKPPRFERIRRNSVTQWNKEWKYTTRLKYIHYMQRHRVICLKGMWWSCSLIDQRSVKKDDQHRFFRNWGSLVSFRFVRFVILQVARSRMLLTDRTQYCR